MSKAKKVRFTGVIPLIDGHVISRVQSLSIDPDLNFTEVYELGNPNIVQYDRDTPDVGVTINTNDFASIFNLRKLTAIPTGVIQMADLEGKSVALSALIEEDNVLKRTVVCVNTYLAGISWNYDVGGIASENFTLATDNKTMFSTAYKQIVALPVTWLGTETTTASGYVASGAGVLATGSSDFYTYSATSAPYALSAYNALYVWNDTFRTGALDTTGVSFTAGPSAQDSQVVWSGENTLDSGDRIFVIAYKTTPQANIDSYSTEPGIATVRKGQVTIEISPSGADETYSQWFRVQTCAVDADLSRDELDELGNHYAYDRSLPDPIVSTVNITMLDTDLEAFYEAAGLSTWDEDTSTEINIDDFARSAAIRVRVYTTKDRLATQLRKEIVLDQIQVTSESFSVDVQDNARQTMTATTSYLTISGADLVAPMSP